MILILYTTRYRAGGPRFAQAARTLAQRCREHSPSTAVQCHAVESKRAVRLLLSGLQEAGRTIDALHFVGHGGLYGPMFGTTQWPEQFSPHEWKTLDIPFAASAEAYFHACRSARWFAPFFARTFGVRTHGYHWYTAFSVHETRFAWAPPWLAPEAPLFVAGCPGRKSHGVTASVRKYAGRMPSESLRAFDPAPGEPGSYDDVAPSYDAVFDDISVRRDELAWLRSRLPSNSAVDVLDIGCGNGALLQALAPRIRQGVGVDASPRMVELARRRNGGRAHLRFDTIAGPVLPLSDASIDVAISMLSFRYLDWDPLLLELQRVLRPGGKLLVVDMVDKPVSAALLPRMLADKLRVRVGELRHPDYRSRRAEMVRSEAWQQMLRYNPMRALHEYEWYLGSRFPRGSMSTLNVGRRARVIAFDTGPFGDAELRAMAYP